MKRILSLCLTALLLLAMVPAANAATDTPYHEWKQYDAQWASVKLSNKTVKQVGCLATSVAMLAVQAELKSERDFDPGVFVKEMRAAGGFTPANDLIWEKIPQAIPGFAAETAWASLKGTAAEKTVRLKGWLAQGYCVAVAVRGGGHWVALRNVAGDTAVMMDPACDTTDLFGKYAASGVTRAALLRTEGTTLTAQSTEPSQKHDEPSPNSNGSIGLAEVFVFLKDLAGLLWTICRQVMKTVTGY